MMNVSAKIAIALSAVMLLASCANTVRGVGRDMSNTAHATEKAAKDVAN